MGFMQNWPLWAFFVMVVVAYLSGHLLGFRPSGQQRPRNWLVLRIVSTTLLLASALLIGPETLWFTLPLAVFAGWLNRRSAPPPLRPAGGGTTPKDGGGTSEGQAPENDQGQNGQR